MTGGLRAVIVDDEAMSRRALRTLLTDVGWVDCVGEATDASSAVETLRALEPDLVFLDVKLPDGSGLQVLERYERPVAIIFTTAFDEYAITAFDIGAVDFLRKPFGQARLLQALERARAHLTQSAHAPPDEVPLAERLAAAGNAGNGGKQATRIFVRDRGSVIPLRTDSISRCEADGDYVAIYASGRRYLVYVNLGDIEA
ncbi:MAG TPA: response regulator, partial [Gammaproteobacteria bacterium]|nr:response regulator [Gammaproteobacteria bacterium]